MNQLTWSKLQKQLELELCPPGNGVFTIHTAKEKRESLHKKVFGTSEGVEKLWTESLNHLPQSNQAVVLGICSDTGGGILRGANWGPLFLRETLLENEEDQEKLPYFDLGDVRVIPHLLHDKYLNGPTIENCRKALYETVDTTLPVGPLSISEDVASSFYQVFPNKGLFGIGGDHSTSYPLVKSYLQAKKSQGKKVALIHFDAHTDLLVERLGIDLCFGSWVTHILGDLHKPSDAIQIGIRSSGKPKEHWEKTFGVQQYWADEVIQEGPGPIAKKIISYLKEEKIEELYVSFDIDALDSTYASATGTPEPNGLSPHDPMVILQDLSKEFPISGADMMEIAPFLKTSEDVQQGPETTLMVGASLSSFLINEITKWTQAQS